MHRMCYIRIVERQNRRIAYGNKALASGIRDGNNVWNNQIDTNVCEVDMAQLKTIIEKLKSPSPEYLTSDEQKLLVNTLEQKEVCMYCWEMNDAMDDDIENSKERKLDRAIEMLRVQYEKALQMEFVRNPLAYALYQTWKIIDKR